MKRLGLFLIVLAIVLIVWHRAHHKRELNPRSSATAEIQRRIGPPDIYPNPILTPGALNPNVTQENILQTICNPDRREWRTQLIRPPLQYTSRLKRDQIREYGYTDTQINHFEEDHLIPLELGGSPTDPKNLWPEPYSPSIPEGGARSKDRVENYLHQEVCSGNISLEEAQREIAFDWYLVYATRVSTSGLSQNGTASQK